MNHNSQVEFSGVSTNASLSAAHKTSRDLDAPDTKT